jgi:hypothetical protein
MSDHDDLQSRLPDPTDLFPEMGAIAGGMIKTIQNGSIPQTTIHLVQLRGAATLRTGCRVTSVNEYAGSVWLVAVPAVVDCTAAAPFGYVETAGTSPAGVQAL